MVASLYVKRSTKPKVLNVAYILYSGKLLREKPFANFTVLWLLVKVFFAKFGGVMSFGAAKVSNPCKFSPSKVSCYMVLRVLLNSLPLLHK